jgi:hypothetical protein
MQSRPLHGSDRSATGELERLTQPERAVLQTGARAVRRRAVGWCARIALTAPTVALLLLSFQ